MMMSPRAWIATAAVIAATTTASHAETKNEVRAVSFTEDGGVTRVHVRGAQTPTFTVYKLERPSRVVIDLPQARLAESLRGHEGAMMLSPNTWAVSGIAAQQLDDGAVRVIVTMARPGRYDVKTDGNEVVVMVMPRDAAPKTTNPAELEAAKQQAQAAEAARAKAERSSEAANATAKQSKAEADTAKAEAERLRTAAAQQSARAEAAQRAVDEARQAAQKNAANTADVERAKQLAEKANAEAARAKAQATKAGTEAEEARKASQLAQIQADKLRMAAEMARRDAVAEAAAAKADAQKARDEMAKARTEVARAQAQAQQEVAKSRAEVEAAKRETAKTRAQLETQTATTRETEAKARAALAAAQSREDAARNAAMQANKEKELAEAAAKRAQVARDSAASADKQKLVAEAKAAEDRLAKARQATDEAEIRRKTAEQLATAARQDLEQTKTALQTVEQQRAAAAAAATDASRRRMEAETALQTVEQQRAAAAAAVMQANKEKQLAEAAAKRAQVARDSAASADKQKLVDEAKAAEARLARARQATDEAETRRKTAEQLATAARQDLEQTKTALQTVEQQRAAAAAAANEASRKRSAAEAAARAADEQRALAESAARAADKQRSVAEAAARDAMAAKRDAEGSLAQLTKKRDAAERAAADVAVRTKAEATAQAQMDAAKARKASDDEIAAARREVAKLTEERKRAEADLAARRTAVAQQQTEAARLETEAAAARDAASREEARRTQLAKQRETEERELAKLKSQKAEAQVAQSRQQTEAARLATEAATARDAAAREEARRTQVAQQRATEERELAKLEAKRVQAQVAQTPQRSVPAPKPATATLATVNSVTFKGSDAGGLVEFAVTGDANVELGEITSRHVELIVDGADLAQKLERTLDVSKFGTPVKKVSTFRDRRTANRVRLIAELGSPAIPTVVRDGNTVRWRFASSTVAKRAPKTTNMQPAAVGGFGAASTPVAQQSVAQLPGAGNRRRTYYGATVEFDFKDAPIHDLLRIIADTGGVNIVVPDSIDAKVTVRLKRVPWDQALEVILASHGLWYRREGNMYRIAPRKELDAEDEAEAARRAAMVAAEQPKPEVVTLNYAAADELKPKLEGMLSPKGKIEVDGRTNALIINDVAGARENIARLALSLDIQTPQITIEARIVEARSTFIRQFGIQWGGRALAGAGGGNATGLIFPSSIGLVGGNTDNQTNDNGITALPSDFAINLPAATGTGEGGAIGLSLGSVGGNFNINLRLSALEDTGTVRIVSAPKITVINNKTALIRQGVSIPISVVSAAGTQTQFVQADLKLEVTPYVSQRDCVIAMNLDVSKNEPDFVNVGARGDPTILRKEAKTTMLVADGETTVLGGIYTRNSGLAYKKVPFFGDLPVIGWFFKNRRENDDRTEILVFITPKITNKASLRCVQ